MNFVLQAVVLDQGLDADLLSDIQKYLEDLISSGLRQRLISLLKVCTFAIFFFFANFHLDNSPDRLLVFVILSIK